MRRSRSSLATSRPRRGWGPGCERLSEGLGINAAVAPTVFHGTGERVRELPIRPSGGARPARPVRACSVVSRQDGSVLADLDAADDDTAQRVDDAAAHPSAVLAHRPRRRPGSHSRRGSRNRGSSGLRTPSRRSIRRPRPRHSRDSAGRRARGNRGGRRRLGHRAGGTVNGTRTIAVAVAGAGHASAESAALSDADRPAPEPSDRTTDPTPEASDGSGDLAPETAYPPPKPPPPRPTVSPPPWKPPRWAAASAGMRRAPAATTGRARPHRRKAWSESGEGGTAAARAAGP